MAFNGNHGLAELSPSTLVGGWDNQLMDAVTVIVRSALSLMVACVYLLNSFLVYRVMR